MSTMREQINAARYRAAAAKAAGHEYVGFDPATVLELCDLLAATEAAKATGTAGEFDADAEMAKVKRDVELMGVGFLVDGKRCSLDRITWFNRPGDTWLPPPPGYPTEAARQPAPVVAVKTWQERMTDGRRVQNSEWCKDEEIADLRAALAATAAPVLSDEQILQIWAGYRSSAVAKGGMIPDPIEFARAILAATNRSQP